MIAVVLHALVLVQELAQAVEPAITYSQLPPVATLSAQMDTMQTPPQISAFRAVPNAKPAQDQMNQAVQVVVQAIIWKICLPVAIASLALLNVMPALERQRTTAFLAKQGVSFTLS